MRLLDGGLPAMTDPFLAATLWDMRTLQLVDLMKKARIKVEKGAVLFGVADPSASLKHGTVVIQLSPLQRE
eukprot:26118-Prorocentrum_minimum.AAC.1